ncbi:uncharacterized protein MCYG_03174 [Microsporum canis CBS 113480]|uniref:Uncharacterized protein n=1 Tax=Arthroderma otae (strain ATCC MYA-4605 / CBS 113480) TaxID=554155 RepID=C5FKY3_ARTOC|nr:uncharacterized protein MCYG_03174 [Microsporum canis CBS 113480]EEQ30355.1 predicted protein [Microsporum canis CBS 113480]
MVIGSQPSKALLETRINRQRCSTLCEVGWSSHGHSYPRHGWAKRVPVVDRSQLIETRDGARDLGFFSGGPDSKALVPFASCSHERISNRASLSGAFCNRPTLAGFMLGAQVENLYILFVYTQRGKAFMSRQGSAT